MTDRGTVQEATSGAPGTITLGGQEWLVAQATDSDLMAVRKRLMKEAKDPLGMYAELLKHPHWRTLPKKVRDEIAKEAGQKAAAKEKVLTPEMATNLLMEPDGCRFFAWVLLRKMHPDLRLEQLTEWITEDNAPDVFAKLSRESGMDALGS